MAVVIRLSRLGHKKQPRYRIMAAAKHRKRDGRYLEILGHYIPTSNPPELKIKADRIRHWVEQGAVASKTVRRIVAKELPGYFKERDEHKRKGIQAARKKRKERIKARGGKKAPKKERVTKKNPAKKKAVKVKAAK